jgi:hypothetical protein
MVKFIDVDPSEISNFVGGRRGRVSYPILKSFLETGKTLVKLDRTGIQQNLQSLTSSLNAYVKSHNLPVKIFQRQGELYLARTDTDEAGKAQEINLDVVPRYVEPVGQAPQELLEAEDIPDVDGSEVARRFEKEKGQVTK